MESNKTFALNQRQKAKIYKICQQKKKMKNNSIFNFLLIIYIFTIFLCLIIQIWSQPPQEQFNHFKKPYISAIYIGKGTKTLVNPSSTITPDRAL